MGTRPLHNVYVSVVLKNGREFCITHNSAIGILEGDIDKIGLAYKVADVNGTVHRGDKVTSRNTLKAIVESVKADSEDIMGDIPERSWRIYRDKKIVMRIRKAYRSHDSNGRNDIPPSMEKYNTKWHTWKKSLPD